MSCLFGFGYRKGKSNLSQLVTICGNSFSLTLWPPTINGVSTIPHFETLCDCGAAAERTGLLSLTYTYFEYSRHSAKLFLLLNFPWISLKTFYSHMLFHQLVRHAERYCKQQWLWCSNGTETFNLLSLIYQKINKDNICSSAASS